MNGISRCLAAGVLAVGTTVVYGANPIGPASAAGEASPEPAPGRAVAPAGGDHPGAGLFAARCAICHGADQLAARFRDASDPDRVEEDLAAFLRTHGRANDAEDAQILDYIRAVAASE